jgi:hypothetical protein
MSSWLSLRREEYMALPEAERKALEIIPRKKAASVSQAQRQLTWGEAASVYRPKLKRPEMNETSVKYFDSSKVSSSVTFNGTVTKLTTITQGVGLGQRVGDGVDVIGIELRGTVYVLTAVNTCVRTIIFQWLLDDTTPPTAAQILQVTGSSMSPASAYLLQSARAGLFGILADWTTEVSGTGDGAKCFRRKFDHLHCDIAFNIALATGMGHLYMLEISDLNATLPASLWYSRVAFVDS